MVKNFLDKTIITTKKMVRIPDKVLEKLESSSNDILAFFDIDGKVFIEKGELKNE